MNYGTDTKKSALSKLGLLVTTMIWGSSFVVVKNATASLPPSDIIFFRFAAAAILLGAIFFKHLKHLTRGQLLHGFRLGVTYFLAYETQTYGVEYTTAGNNAFLTAVYCVVVPFLTWALLKRRPNRFQIISAFLCIAGVGLLSLKSGFSMNIGDLLSLLSGFFFAAQILEICCFTKTDDPIALTILEMAATALLSLPSVLFLEKPAAAPGTDLILAIIYLAVVGTALTSLAQTVCQKYVEPSSASIIMSLESVFGVLCGVIFLREPVSARSLGGCALIFCAILLSEKQPHSAAVPAVPPAE